MAVSKEISGKRFLVTGGAGFIGRRVVKLLADSGGAVSIVDNLSVGLPMPEDPRFETHKADICDEATILSISKAFRPDVIVHLAAVHHIPTCEKRRAYSLGVNVIGTEILLDVAEQTGAQRFLLASSGAVYDWAEGELNESTTPLRAADNYALAKLTNERQATFWGERTGQEVRLVRIFNTIGYDDPNAHLIPDILNQLHRAKGRAIIELGNTKPRRDYIHADDTAEGIALIAADRRSGTNIDTLNVCSGTETSVEALVRLIGAKMGIEIDIRENEARKRRVDRLSQLGDPSHMKSCLDWSAKTSIEDAVGDIVKNFSFN